MALGQLPMEMILELLPYLTPHDYFQLVLVCKSWYDLFIPHIYHRVMLPLNDFSAASYGQVCGGTDLPVRRLTHAVIEKPALARLIHSLEICFSVCEGGGHREPHKDEDAWLALLLVQVRNLEILKIALGEEKIEYGLNKTRTSSVHFEWVIHWASMPRLGILPKLSHVSLIHGPAPWTIGTVGKGVALHRLIPFLRIPSMRELYVINPGDRVPLKLPKDVMFPVKHLDIAWPQEPLRNLPRLVERCPELESFTLEQDYWHDETTHSLLDLSRLYQPLRVSRSSIRHLNLTFNGIRAWQDAEMPRPTFLGTLSDFSNLDSVHMRWSDLLPFRGQAAYHPITSLSELLPSSLRHLHINDCLVQCMLALSCTLLRRVNIRFAMFVQQTGHGCLHCLMHHWRPSWPHQEIAAGTRLYRLHRDFNAFGVSLFICPAAMCVPFARDYAIRKK
ncbi:hypothetical protein BO94DRAFT_554692 [Aspergillus sclerotioniger CBS 115572]|uniref:F-box domain-containing protein n=1 Tax=Aspergillus sclerotioniger CBS 115572 TaxID=1450535 RepID=A0A317X6F7_9EURO|nr:hypothetical protein BO94DRAFT_554692 [Aspergillus sclerotioniger CBS 115572]PWY93147.1 hypothetical protein BO94DRAFT_554692 [Aspergillus sclerotioniger CBS 115572]